MNTDAQPLLAILMGTYNGEKYISDQLMSIQKQTHRRWKLYISDDGSSDRTRDIIHEHFQQGYADTHQLRDGPKAGFCQNFLSLACDKSISADYYAFCDQDDIWQDKKIESALNAIRKQESAGIPFLYFGRTTYVKDDLVPYAYSKTMRKPLHFHNALLQSVAGGNTIVFNDAAKKLIEKVGLVPAISHDWWLYQLVTGSGGMAFYDENSYILYRQHASALIGGNTSLVARLKRIKNVISNQFCHWNNQNIQCLKLAESFLTADSRSTLNNFIRLRHSHLIDRALMIHQCQLYRQTRLGTLSLVIAAIFKKL